jgi:TetR/AcrR family transcriptional repressor of nem operon
MPRPKEFDRDEVLQRAMITFRDHGYEATAMQELVDRMAINRFSLYSTFTSKHELFVESLQAYLETVAVPFFSRLESSGEGLSIIEKVLQELVTRIKGGESPNGCLLCNTIAELGSHTDKRIKLVLETYLKLQEGYFHAALLRAKELREIPEEVDVRGHAKLLVGYTTGILGTAKVLSEKEMRRSVRATIAAIK